MAPVAVLYGIDPVHFGLIMVFNLVLALIHPPIGLVIFLVSSMAKVSVERLSIMILPWLAVSLVVLFLVTYLPSEAVLALSNLVELRSANALGVAAMLAWGVAYVPSAWLVETWPPLSAAGARLTLAGLVLLGVLARSGRPLRPGVGPMTIGWLALTQTVLFYGATFWGIAQAGAGLSAVLANTRPALRGRAGGRVPRRAARGAPVGRPRDRPGRRGGGGLGGAALAAGPVGRRAVVVGGALAWSIGTVAAARRCAAAPSRSRWPAGRWPPGGCARPRRRGREGRPRPTGARERGPDHRPRRAGLGAPAGLFYLALGDGARRRGVDLVLPGAGHRGRERVAAPRRGAPGAAPDRPGRRSRWGSGWCSAGGQRAGGVGRLGRASVTATAPARRP